MLARRTILPYLPYLLPALLAGLALFTSAAARAQLSVDQAVFELGAAAPTQDLTMRNDGDFRLYVALEVAEILEPGSETPRRVELDDPRTAAVLVSPARAMLEPGQTKRVRIILREPAIGTDRVFRLALEPAAGNVRLDPAASNQTATGIKVLLGYDLLLLSRPERLDPGLAVQRTDTHLTVSNTGNTAVLLRRVHQCEADGLGCEALQPNRLYAGESARFVLPKPGPAARYPVEIVSAVGRRSSSATY